MWPRDAYVGQHVIAIIDLDGIAALVKGKVYTIEGMTTHPTKPTILYFYLNGHGSIATRFDLLRPVDPKRLDVFRRQHADA